MISNLQPFRRRCVVRYHSENVRFQYKPVLTIFYCCIPYSFILPYFKPAVNYPNMQNIFKNLSRKIYTFTQKNEQTEVHSSKILFSLFQRRFKPSHDNISRLNSVLLAKRRRVTKRIIQTKLFILYLAHSVIRQNVKRFQSLEL